MNILFARRFDGSNTPRNNTAQQPEPSRNVLHSEDKFTFNQSLGDGQKFPPQSPAFALSILFGPGRRSDALSVSDLWPRGIPKQDGRPGALWIAQS